MQIYNEKEKKTVSIELLKYDMFLEEEISMLIYPDYRPPFPPEDNPRQLFAAHV